MKRNNRPSVGLMLLTLIIWTIVIALFLLIVVPSMYPN